MKSPPKKVVERTSWKTFGVVLSLAAALSSCNPESRAAKQLIEEKGVTVDSGALLEALQKEDRSLAAALLTLGAKPDATTETGVTPLMIASRAGEIGLVEKLIKAGEMISANDDRGRNALEYAVKNDHVAVTHFLLDHGADPAQKTSEGGDLVAEALSNGQLACVQLLLNAGASPQAKDRLGASLTRIAVQDHRPEFLEKISALGVELSQETGEGESLLHLALQHGDDDTVEFLLDHGLHPDEKNLRGETLLHQTVTNSRLDLLPVLADHGADLNLPNPEGWCPLHLAIMSRDQTMLTSLLESGAEVGLPSVQAENAITPLPLAIENRHLGMAKALLRYGASGGDELYRAVQVGGDYGRDLVELFLSNGVAAGTLHSHDSDTPLALAVRSGEDKIAKLLLDAGAPCQLPGPSGQKPLHVAIARSDEKMAKLLLESGADPNEPFNPNLTEDFLEQVKTEGIGRWALQNSKTFAPLMLASDNGNVELARLLIEHGASTSKSAKVKSNRFWPLTFATRRSDVPMMQTILKRKPGRSKIWIKVDLSEQRAYVYENDKQLFSSRVSTGKRGHRTRTGEFVITNKYRDWTSTIYDSSMPYFQRLSASDFGFHVGYVPGYAASHGCIRMPHSVARKLFKLTKVGDYVKIVK